MPESCIHNFKCNGMLAATSVLSASSAMAVMTLMGRSVAHDHPRIAGIMLDKENRNVSSHQINFDKDDESQRLAGFYG